MHKHTQANRSRWHKLQRNSSVQIISLEVYGYLEDKLVWLAEFGEVLVKLLILLDLLVVRGVEQQLLDVSRLQPVLRAHGHEDLPQLGGGQLQVSYQDGWAKEAGKQKHSKDGQPRNKTVGPMSTISQCTYQTQNGLVKFLSCTVNMLHVQIQNLLSRSKHKCSSFPVVSQQLRKKSDKGLNNRGGSMEKSKDKYKHNRLSRQKKKKT